MRATVYCATTPLLAVKEWLGFCTVDEPPSPKVHDQEVGELVELSVKLTLNGLVPLVGVPEKLATGAGVPCVTMSRATSMNTSGFKVGCPVEQPQTRVEMEPPEVT